MEAIVIGAGIGGFAAALSLHAAAVRCRVYESLPRLQPLGVGMNLLPHATKELDDLGLLPRLQERGAAVRELVYLTRGGRIAWREPRGLEAGYRWPQIAILRGELMTLLYEAFCERLGSDAVYTDHQAIDVTQDSGKSATVHFRRRTDRAKLPERSADLVVGADGIHSAIRARFHPGEGPPKWGGKILWRGTTVARPILDGATMVIAGDATNKFICHPVRHLDGGLQLVHWLAEVSEPNAAFRKVTDWNRHGSGNAFLPRFAGWSDELIDIPALVGGAGAVYEYPMSDRDPLASLVFGRVALLGDAAHPIYPVGSNGAAQAILDARKLAFELAVQPSVDAALTAYDAARRPATAQLLAAHRADGPDAILGIVAARAPDDFDDLESVVPYGEREQLSLRYRAAAGFDLPALNESPPMTPPRPARRPSGLD